MRFLIWKIVIWRGKKKEFKSQHIVLIQISLSVSCNLGVCEGKLLYSHNTFSLLVTQVMINFMSHGSRVPSTKNSNRILCFSYTLYYTILYYICYILQSLFFMHIYGIYVYYKEVIMVKFLKTQTISLSLSLFFYQRKKIYESFRNFTDFFSH